MRINTPLLVALIIITAFIVLPPINKEKWKDHTINTGNKTIPLNSIQD